MINGVLFNDKTKKSVPINLRYGYYDKTLIKKEIFTNLISGLSNKNIPSSLWAKVFKKELVVEFMKQVDKHIKIGEDAAVVKPAVYKADSLYVCAECDYFYRNNLSSLTKSKKAFYWDGPKLRGMLLERQFNLDEFDFRGQIYRSVVHSLFNVVVSQFNRQEEYGVIVKDIKEHLNDPYYKNAIKNCKPKSGKLRLAKFALKYKIFWLIKLYNRSK